jgi:hypothetical protein
MPDVDEYNGQSVELTAIATGPVCKSAIKDVSVKS